MQDTIPQQRHRSNPPTTYSNEPTSATNIYPHGTDTKWSRTPPCAFFFSMGNPKCHGVRATVDEDSSAVLITLYEGTLPNAPTECAEIAVNASLLLTTRNPIGTRSVITG